MVYLDDASGATVRAANEVLLPQPLGGVWCSAASTPLQPAPPAAASRCDIHMAITAATFREAGWDIAVPKVQRGLRIEMLGFDIATELPNAGAPSGAIICPEAKRLGLIEEIGHQKNGRPTALFSRVQRLVGRLGHIAQVAPEAKVYLHLHPMFRLACAADARGRRLTWISVSGPGPAVSSYQDSLSWWEGEGVLRRGISVPLATPAAFPRLGEPGCAALFTDAAREHGGAERFVS